MPPTFYFAIGARARRRDLAIAMLVGQCHYLVPAGSPMARLLAQTPGVHIVLDSWAFPPGNTDRPSLPRYAHLVADWYARNLTSATQQEAPWFDWALSYDTIGDALASERDEYRLSELLQTLCHYPDPPLVPVTHYPGPGAEAIVGDLLRDRELCFDDEEIAQMQQRASWAFLDAPDGPTDRPAYAIGGLVPARYARAAAAWYQRLIAELDAAAELDPLQRRIHLLGVGKPSWVCCSPLVKSFDSSGPARMALIGFERGISRAYTDAYGLSIAKLRRSREARLVYHLADYRARVGLPWQRVDEAVLLDDREAPALSVLDQECWQQPALAALDL
jgi:hypothetical protein